MLKKLLLNIAFISFFIFFGSIFAQVNAAMLDFDKESAEISTGETVDISVRIDSGSEQISSTDAYVLYDPGLLEVLEIQAGDYFPTVVSNITSGRLYIAGLVDDASTSETGTGLVATITFKGLSKGEATLAYDCQDGVYNSSKIIQNDVDATNIIDCSASGTSIISISTGENTNGSSTGGANNTGGTNNSNSTASALPRSGIFDNIAKAAVPGMILLFLGGALRLIL